MQFSKVKRENNFMEQPSTKSNIILAGMNGRFFPSNWRPALDEIAFAGAHGFQAIQFGGRETGLDEAGLGASFSKVAERLKETNITAVMEIVVRLSKDGVTELGLSPMEVLQANLPAITELPCQSVHWHLVHTESMTTQELVAMESTLIPQFEQGVKLAAAHGFRFGFEHNEIHLHSFFNEPERCHYMLDAVPGLHFVWDFNHTPLEHLEQYKSLIPRMSMLHISDTPLPETNHHLPLGQGNINFDEYFHALHVGGFSGAAILEIGGLPKSGGYGRDSDSALIASLSRLERSIGKVD